MGTVHVARDTLLDRLVAIKFIAALVPDEVARRRFHNEARALARLAHPNVVAIHRVGEIEGRPYLVCELVEGKSLEEQQLPLPVTRVITIGVSAARGLAAVHRHGVLHRDIKPANIILMADGEAKLLDFGLATFADPARPVPPGERAATLEDWALTADGNVVGTWSYIAPEIRAGEPATRRSDVYSLGAVLYELCCSFAPSPNIPDRAPASQNAALSAIIARCLEEDPELRFSSGDVLRDALEQLLPAGREAPAAEQRALERLPLTAFQAPAPEGNPYPGLRPFEAERRSLFFGRLAEVRTVVDRLRSEPIVLVVGDSGVGKSSLCRAGVVPLVVEGQLDPARLWRAVTLVPGRRPTFALATALAPALGMTEDHCVDLLRSEPGALGRALRRRLGSHEGLLIFIDQAEELIALADVAEAGRVSEALAGLGNGPVRVLATVRGDLFTRVAALPGLGDSVPAAMYLLRGLSKEQLREIVVGPARRAGGRFQSDALVEGLVDAAADAPGGVALLSFALAELWELRDPVRQVITAAALEKIGGVAGALARHADGVLAGMPPAERQAVPRILTRLVTTEGSRARKTAGELDAGDAGRAALEVLVRGRLLVASEVGGETAYELAHEALIAGWAQLRGWLSSDAAARATRQRLITVAGEWQRLGHDRSLLWSTRQLYEIDQLDEAELEDAERSFIAASRRSIRRRRARLIATVLGAIAFAGAVYAAMRVQAHASVAAAVLARRTPALRALESAQAHAAVSAALRDIALARFRDPGPDPTGAGRVWQAALDDAARARAIDRIAEDQLVGAGQALEAASLLDPADGETRRLLTEVTALRLTLAERNFERQAAQELRMRLATYSADNALDAPAKLSVNATPAGALVTLERYQDDEGRLRPTDPQALGTTPLAARAVPAGSYRVTVEAAGRVPVRYPVLLAAGERFDVHFELPSEKDVPAGMIYVPPGRFLYGSADDDELRRFLGAPPQHQVVTGGYLIGATEVTFGEYLEFLRDLPPAQRVAHLPRAENAIRGALALEELPDGVFRLTLKPASTSYAALEGEPIRYQGRDRRAVQDWRRFPVAAVSWTDLLAYTAWLDRTGRVPTARPCTEHEWERAARGADERVYPQGDRVAPDDADMDATYGRRPEAYGPDEVGSHRASDSPFGVRDLVGNVWEWTASVQLPGQPSVRGGSYYQEEFTDRSTNRDVGEAEARDPLVGMRVCATFTPP